MLNDEDLLLVSDVARLLDVSAVAVRDMERRGLLQSVRVGRNNTRLFSRAAVERLAEQRAAQRQSRDVVA